MRPKFGVALAWLGLALLAYFVYLVVQPFLNPLAWAAVIAIVFYPAHAPVARDYLVTLRQVDPPPGELALRFEALRRAGLAELHAEGVPVRRIVARRLLQVRYLGQAHELEVPFGADYRRRFARAHARLYGYDAADRPTEVLALRLTLLGTEPATRSARRAPRVRAAPPGAPHEIVWRGSRLEIRRHERDELSAGTRLAGPALVVEFSSTVLVPPGWSARVDAERNLRLFLKRRVS